MSDYPTSEQPSIMQMMTPGPGIRAGLRQLAAAAAITWGTRQAICQANEAHAAAAAAAAQLSEIQDAIAAASQRLAELYADARSIVECEIESGNFDHAIGIRWRQIEQDLNKPDPAQASDQ